MLMRWLSLFLAWQHLNSGWIFLNARIRAGSRFKWFCKMFPRTPEGTYHSSKTTALHDLYSKSCLLYHLIRFPTRSVLDTASETNRTRKLTQPISTQWICKIPLDLSRRYKLLHYKFGSLLNELRETTRAVRGQTTDTRSEYCWLDKETPEFKASLRTTCTI
jgi:hypothetical protein